MIDSQNVKTKVELLETSPNELIGEHTVYMTFGTFVFENGILEVSQDVADKLKAEGIVK